ncbi:MAG: type II toxin-antitoxin system YafQ family toxin [Calditrichales bacterium]|nr:type II toxin-antitoxin system YafQ family toxin [Calditrichales bacterium]
MKIEYTTQFKKDYKRIKKQNKNLQKLRVVINKLTIEEKLDLKYKDHSLTGSLKGYRDCHIEPDWLLLYKLSGDTLLLERTGSHSELFK